MVLEEENRKVFDLQKRIVSFNENENTSYAVTTKQRDFNP